MIKFKAYNPVIKMLRADKSFRVELDISSDQWDVVKDLPKLQDMVLNITIEEGEKVL